jgi:hypothetical protein
MQLSTVIERQISCEPNNLWNIMRGSGEKGEQIGYEVNLMQFTFA